MELLRVMIMMALISSTNAYDFYVGGKDGWTENPSEAYNHWAERTRFQIHDKLVFKYKQGKDSVLVVKKEDYDSCDTKNPMKKLDDGDSVFEFDRSGPFYFVGGVGGNCEKGQKLIVVVLADRSKKPVTPTPSPPSSSPAPSVESPSPSVTPPTTSPSPYAPSPTPVASPSPTTTSPSPVSISPNSNVPSPSVTPPTTSPSPYAPSPTTMSPSPVSVSPSSSVPSTPSSPNPSSPDTNVSPVSSPPGNNKSSAAVATRSSLSLGVLVLFFASALLS